MKFAKILFVIRLVFDIGSSPQKKRFPCFIVFVMFLFLVFSGMCSHVFIFSCSSVCPFVCFFVICVAFGFYNLFSFVNSFSMFCLCGFGFECLNMSYFVFFICVHVYVLVVFYVFVMFTMIFYF